ncbi:MAG: right-handed parallel beta-helix repeat-containing protein [Verrucomicrobia bacterium]|nr:right-handed parallel beta-helix repeat-containing protein [Verrucomicrobiota bacterium]
MKARSLLAVLLGLLLPSAGKTAEPIVIHVAPDGDDGGPGTEARPFASLTRARDAVRQRRLAAGSQPGPMVVQLRGGTYRLAQPFELLPEDSGTPESPVIYRARSGDRAVVSGGRRLQGWRPATGGRWVVTVPGVREGEWYPHQLFVDGVRRPRARTPNEGYLRTRGPLVTYPRDRTKAPPEARIGFRFAPGDVQRWPDWREAEIVLYHAWTASWHGIAEIDEPGQIVRFTNPCGWPVGWWEKEQRFRIENHAAALDTPGEWHLDRQSGELTYWPPAGEDPRSAEVVMPELRVLVRFAGEPDRGRFVEHVRMVGLSFQHSDWAFDRTKLADGQAAVFLGAAIAAQGARHCTLEACEVAHVGEYAVNFARGCRDNRIERCHLHDLGAGGVRLGEAGRTAKDLPQADAVRTGGNVVHNNFIHDGGHVFPAGIGVWVGQSANNTITHNEVCDFDYSGMSLGWTWGYGPHEARGNRVEYNHIHHLGRGVLSDLGGIYTLGVQPGTVLRHNVIHDVLSYSYGGWGLYTDEGSTDILLENNLVYLTKTGGFHQHYGRNNVVRNNIFALAAEEQIKRSRQEEHVSFVFERNIVYQDKGPLLGGSWGNRNFRMAANVYWRAGYEPTWSGLPFADWQAESGQDAGSVVADPGFVDVARRDFRLRPDSPALRLGFQPFEAGRAGLVGPAEWTGLPGRIQRPATAFAAWREQPAIGDDFEAVPAGQRPAQATFSGVEGGAAVAITAEVAASGRQSLRVVDAAGLERDYHPHFVYKPSLLAGRVRVAMDLRVENGAQPWFECRDAASPYRVGPSVRVDGQGRLLAGKRVLLTVPTGAWVRIEATFQAGRGGPGTYDLIVGLPGGETRRFDALPFGHREFQRLQWFGFMSMAKAAATYYVDNLAIEPIR